MIGQAWQGGREWKPSTSLLHACTVHTSRESLLHNQEERSAGKRGERLRRAATRPQPIWALHTNTAQGDLVRHKSPVQAPAHAHAHARRRTRQAPLPLPKQLQLHHRRARNGRSLLTM